MTRATRLGAAAFILAVAGHPLGAQSPVRECITGAATFAGRIDSSAAPLQPLLDALQWRKSRQVYASVVAREGALAGFDSVVSRANTLLEATRAQETDSLLVRALNARFMEVRSHLSVNAPVPARVPRYSDFAAQTGRAPGEVDFIDSDGDRSVLRFTDANMASAIALCASARTMHSYLDFLNTDALRAVATQYADAARRWELYIEEGYSMTLIERLAASWLFNARHRRTPEPLGPPKVHAILLHPSGGLTAYRSGSTNYPPVSVVEWAGVVGHRYTANSMRSWGISGATFYPLNSRPGNGVLVHALFFKVGAYDLDDWSPQRRPQIVVTADVQGWIPGVRRAARSLVTQALTRPWQGKVAELASQAR